MGLLSLNVKTVNYQEQLQAIQTIRTIVFQEEQGVATELEFDGLDAIALKVIYLYLCQN